MRKLKPLMFSFLLSIAVIGCLDVGEAYQEDLNGGYSLLAADEKDDMILCYTAGEDRIGILAPTVFGVGQNDSFIIIEQHPLGLDGRPNKADISYYIIPLKYRLSKSHDENFYGPMSSSGFDRKKNELGINALAFTIIFKDLE